MSEACRETTWRQLSWTADWHVREECYAQALAGLIDAQHRQPLAAHWGSGTTSSSDAPFFHAGARGEVGGLVNLHYGQDPGVKFYTHLSDQFGPFHTKVIAATANPMNGRYSAVVLAGLSGDAVTRVPDSLFHGDASRADVLVLPNGGKAKALVTTARELTKDLSKD